MDKFNGEGPQPKRKPGRPPKPEDPMETAKIVCISAALNACRDLHKERVWRAKMDAYALRFIPQGKDREDYLRALGRVNGFHKAAHGGARRIVRFMREDFN